MKLVLAVIQDTDAVDLIKTLSQHRFDATKLASTGGFLREGNTTLLIGVEDTRLESLKTLIHESCRSRTRLMPVSIGENELGNEPIEVAVGGAVLFVLNVQEFVKL